MAKLLTFLLLIALTLGSFCAYVILTEKINSGSEKIAAGQKQIDDGEKLLAQGKDRLAAGKRKLSDSQRVYRSITSLPFMNIVDKLPISDITFKIAHEKIGEGESLVSQGSAKIQAGEAQLAQGKLELERGTSRLAQTNRIRMGCAFGTGVFAFLAIVLGLYWRRDLIKVFR